MEAEVNLSDAQTELRPASGESGENEEADTSKFKISGDEDDEENEEEEEEEEEEMKENDENYIESEIDLSVTSNLVTQTLEPVTEEIGLKEE